MLISVKRPFTAARALFKRDLASSPGDSPPLLATRPETTSRLLDLPQELFDLVVDYLDISGAASLSLCCKGIKFRKDPKQQLYRACGHEDQRKGFLIHYARDHPEYYFCHGCCNLHVVSRILLPALYSLYAPQRFLCEKPYSGRSIDADSFAAFGNSLGYQLTFSHAQLVMARHVNGSTHGIPVRFLEFTQVNWTVRIFIACV